jgi:hypothetical protein
VSIPARIVVAAMTVLVAAWAPLWVPWLQRAWARSRMDRGMLELDDRIRAIRRRTGLDR